MIVCVPNLEPSTVSDLLAVHEYRYGSAQKREENILSLKNFMMGWKESPKNADGYDLNQAFEVAMRHCAKTMQYGYVSRKDIVQQVLLQLDIF